ncbi:MAG: hypothetical protein ACKVOH_00740 [Chlamydiales bacterium]
MYRATNHHGELRWKEGEEEIKWPQRAQGGIARSANIHTIIAVASALFAAGTLIGGWLVFGHAVAGEFGSLTTASQGCIGGTGLLLVIAGGLLTTLTISSAKKAHIRRQVGSVHY